VIPLIIITREGGKLTKLGAGGGSSIRGTTASARREAPRSMSGRE
jgi:hypothetical protein